MGFENDVFISYAHLDNETLSEEQKGWISALHRAIEVRLGQLLGKKPKIFRDPKLQGNDDFGERLVGELPKTATLISVFTPRYVKSDWCTKELREFVHASEQTIGVQVGTKSRIFKIIKTPVPVERQPEEVQGLLGYEFYSVDPDTGRPLELSADDPPEQQRRYWAKLNDLAHDVCELIEELEPEAAQSAAALPAVPAGEGATVFLAETSYDLREKRDAMLPAGGFLR